MVIGIGAECAEIQSIEIETGEIETGENETGNHKFDLPIFEELLRCSYKLVRQKKGFNVIHKFLFDLNLNKIIQSK